MLAQATPLDQIYDIAGKIGTALDWDIIGAAGFAVALIELTGNRSQSIALFKLLLKGVEEYLE